VWVNNEKKNGGNLLISISKNRTVLPVSFFLDRLVLFSWLS